MEQSIEHLRRFYVALDELERRIGGRRRLVECGGRLSWPARGVYFFFEPGEMRRESGEGSRIVRVGTHALKPGSATTLWKRLSQHQGARNSGGGNHRGSVFRLHVGAALANRNPELSCSSWSVGSSTTPEVRDRERRLETMVSEVIGAMSLLWLEVDDPAGPESRRGYVERNAIALLSTYRRPVLDPPSTVWLGQHSASERIRRSGLWNSNHVDETYDPSFLDHFERLVVAA